MMASGGRGKRRTPTLRPVIAAVVLLVVVAVVAIGLAGGTGGAKPAAQPTPSGSHRSSSAPTTSSAAVGCAPAPRGCPLLLAGTEAADASVAATPFAGGASITGLTVTSPDDAALALPQPRLVFSAVRGSDYPPAKQLTLTNTTASVLQLTNLRLDGPNAASFRLDGGQPTTLAIPAGASATVAVSFHPPNPAGCPTTAQPLAIARHQQQRAALLRHRRRVRRSGRGRRDVLLQRRQLRAHPRPGAVGAGLHHGRRRPRRRPPVHRAAALPAGHRRGAGTVLQGSRARTGHAGRPRPLRRRADHRRTASPAGTTRVRRCRRPPPAARRATSSGSSPPTRAPRRTTRTRS